MDHCLLEQLEEKLSGLKLKPFDVSLSILALTEDTTVCASFKLGKMNVWLHS